MWLVVTPMDNRPYNQRYKKSLENIKNVYEGFSNRDWVTFFL